MARPREWTPDLELLRRRHAGAELEELALDYGASVSTLSRYLKANEQVMDDLAAAEQPAEIEQTGPVQSPARRDPEAQPPAPSKPAQAPAPTAAPIDGKVLGVIVFDNHGNVFEGPQNQRDFLEQKDREREEWATEFRRRRAAVPSHVPDSALEQTAAEYERERANHDDWPPFPYATPVPDQLRCPQCGDTFQRQEALDVHAQAHAQDAEDDAAFGVYQGGA